MIGCNGWRVPLTPTGTRRRASRRRALSCMAARGEPASDGARRRAVDVRSLRSLVRPRGRGLHVSRRASRRPQLRAFPVNAYEAESRRLARFFPFGHTTGPSPEPRPLTRARVSEHARSSLVSLSRIGAAKASNGTNVGDQSRRERVRLLRRQVARFLPTVSERVRRAHGRQRPGAAALAAVLEAFAAMGIDARQAAQDKARRLMVENDVTFAALGDRDTSRQWRLDLFPLLLGPDEWSAIERGVVQRTLLLNRLLGDLYGAAARAEGSAVAAGPRLRQPAIPPAVHEHRRARRLAPELRRVRSRALRRRPLVGRQRPHAGAVGRRLCARESRRLLAVPAGAVRGAQRRRLASFFRAFSERFLSLSRARSAAGRVPFARSVEAELFRARVSRALPGFQHGRRLGPHRARRPRVLEDRRGAQARRPHHASHQLRALRSARAAHGLARRRAGPRAGGARGQGHDRQCARLRARRERLVLELPAKLAPSTSSTKN